MSTIPMINGATHCIKLKPTAAMIPDGVSNTDQIFSIANLTDSKFANWKLIADSSSKVGISNSSVELLRYIDSNYNILTHNGNVIFSGIPAEGSYYYLQTGAALSKSNSSSVLTDLGHVCSHGFVETSGNFVDRCGYRDLYGTGVTYNGEGLLDKSVVFPNATNNIVYCIAGTHITNPPLLINEGSKFSLHILFKRTDINPSGNHGIAVWGSSLGSASYGNDIYFSSHMDLYDVIFSQTGIFSDDTWALLSLVYDGTQTDADNDIQNTKRFKVYVNGLPVEYTYEWWGTPHTIPDTLVDASGSSFTFGSIGVVNPGSMDEVLLSSEAHSNADILLRVNQWMTNSTYWTATIQPVILSCTVSGILYQFNGSGFSPDGSIPTITCGGHTLIPIDGYSDTQLSVIIPQSYITGILTITNCDNESDSISLTIHICTSINASPINISHYTDTSVNICLVDEENKPINASAILLSSSGYINAYGVGYTAEQAKSIYLLGGVIHKGLGINTFLAEDTQQGLGICVLR